MLMYPKIIKYHEKTNFQRLYSIRLKAISKVYLMLCPIITLLKIFDIRGIRKMWICESKFYYNDELLREEYL